MKLTWTPIIFIISLANLALLPSCLSPKRNAQEVKELLKLSHDTNSTFILSGPITGQAIEGPKTASWGLPEILTYTMTACPIDKKTRAKIHGTKFRIQNTNHVDILKSINGSQLEPTVAQTDDADGCFTWQEDFKFQFFHEESTVVIERLLVVQSDIHKGMIKIKFGINPWARYRNSGQKEFVDLQRDFNSVKNTKVLTSDKQAEIFGFQGDQNSHEQSLQSKDFNRLKLDQLSIRISDAEVTKIGSKVNVQLEFNPSIVTVDKLGHNNQYQLQIGYFGIQLHLFLKNRTNGLRKHIGMYDYCKAPHNCHEIESFTPFQDGRFISPIMPIVLDWDFSKLEISDMDLELGIKVIPYMSSDLKKVKPFEGIYFLNDTSNMIGNQKAWEIPNENQATVAGKNFELNEVVSKSKSQNMSQNRNSLASLYFDYADVNFSQLIKDQNVKQKIAFTIKTCVTRMLSRNSLKKSTFIIEGIKTEDKLDPKPAFELRSDEMGCLNWFDTLDYFDKQAASYKKINYKITHKNSGQSINLNILMNPWDYGWTFGKDERVLPEDFHKYKGTQIPTEIFSYRFDYMTIGFRYEVDEYLNLKVKKRVLLELHPFEIRANDLVFGQKAQGNFKNGIYLLQVAVHKRYLDSTGVRTILGRPTKGIQESGGQLFFAEMDYEEEIKTIGEAQTEYVYIVQKLVAVKNGMIITPIELEFDDLRILRIQGNFLFQLKPVNEDLLEATTGFTLEHTKKSHVKEVLQKTRIKELLKQNGITNNEDQNRIIQSLPKDPKGGFKLDINLKDWSDQINKDFNLSLALQEEDQQIQQALEERKKTADTGPKTQIVQGQNHPSPLAVGIMNYEHLNFSLTRQMLDEELLLKDALEVYGQKMSLNDLVYPENVSGFKYKTFMGPVTFLYDSNGSYVRSTDNFDENFCVNDDCNEVAPASNADNTDAQFYNDKSVDDFFEVLAKKRKQKRLKNQYQSLLVNYLDHFAFQYVDLGQKENAQNEENSSLAYYDGDLKELYNHSCVKDVPLGQEDLVSNGFHESCLRPLDKNQDLYSISAQKFFEKMNFDGKSEMFFNDGAKSVLKNLVDQYTKKNSYEKSSFLKSLFHKIPLIGPTHEIMEKSGQYVIERQKNQRWDQAWEEATQKEFGRKEAQDLLTTGHIDPFTANRLCYFWASYMYGDRLIELQRKLIPNTNDPFIEVMDENDIKEVFPIQSSSRSKALNKKQNDPTSFYLKCIENAMLSPNKVFTIGRHVRTLEMGKRNLFRGGMSLNINVTVHDSLSISESISTSSTASNSKSESNSINLGGGFNLKLPKLDLISADAKASKNLSEDFSNSQSLSASSSGSTSEGSDVNSGTYLAMQRIRLDLELKKFKQCLTIRPNLSFLLDIGFKEKMFSDFPQTAIDFMASWGVLICDKTVESKGLKLPEYYYYYTQHFVPSGDLMFSAELLNNPWMIQIRGQVDNAKFMSYIIDSRKVAEDPDKIFTNVSDLKNRFMNLVMSGSTSSSNITSYQNPIESQFKDALQDGPLTALYTDIDMADLPLNMLIHVYDHFPPTYPGIYSIHTDAQQLTRTYIEKMEKEEFPHPVIQKYQQAIQKQDFLFSKDPVNKVFGKAADSTTTSSQKSLGTVKQNE